MSSLLRRLHVETFVLNLREPLAVAPPLPGYGAALVDDHTLEVEVSKEENLNDIFARLSALGIEVLSMRNKVNRLEEIFMQLVEGRGAPDEAARTALPAPAARVRRNEQRRRGCRTASDPPQRGSLDRLQDHRHPRVRAHHPHLGPDHRAV